MVSIGGPGITALKAAGGGRIKYMYSSQGPEDMFIQPKITWTLEIRAEYPLHCVHVLFHL